MIAPSSLAVALPACFPMASGGALIDFTSIISLFRHFVKPLSMLFLGGEVLFLPCFLHAHFRYYVRHIDTHRQSTMQGHENTDKHGENRKLSNTTLHRSILVGRLTLQKY